MIIRAERSSSKVEGSSFRDSVPYCSKHDELVRFLCVSKGCLKELCGHCILEHQSHINHIKTIESVIEDAVQFYHKFDAVSAQESLLSTQNANARELDALQNSFLDHFNMKINRLKKEMIAQDQMLQENVANKESFLHYSKNIGRGKKEVDESELERIQNYLRSESIKELPTIKIEADNYLNKFSDLFDDSVKVIRNGISLDSSQGKGPKVIDLSQSYCIGLNGTKSDFSSTTWSKTSRR